LFHDQEIGKIFAKTIISVLHEEHEFKVEKLKYKKLEVMQLRIKTKSELLAGDLIIPDKSILSFTVMID